MTVCTRNDMRARSTDVISQQEMAIHVDQCLGLLHYTLIMQNV